MGQGVISVLSTMDSLRVLTDPMLSEHRAEHSLHLERKGGTFLAAITPSHTHTDTHTHTHWSSHKPAKGKEGECCEGIISSSANH